MKRRNSSQRITRLEQAQAELLEVIAYPIAPDPPSKPGHVYACAWRSGKIEFLEHLPRGALNLGHGERSTIERIVTNRARHCRNSDQLLVRGVPEAQSEAEACKACLQFSVQLMKDLAREAAS